MKWNRKLSIASLMISLFAGVMSCVLVVGGKASLATVLMIYILGFGGGASLASFVMKKKVTVPPRK